MINMENDMQSQSTMMVNQSTNRYIVVEREIAREDNKLVFFQSFEEATVEKARERLSSCVDDYKRRFTIVFSEWDKQMMMHGDKFECECARGMYYAKVFDAMDYTEESSSGYIWQFDEQGVPVSCSANGK